MGGVDGAFARMLEVHGYPCPDGGLDLAKAPVGLAGMADKGAGLDQWQHKDGVSRGV